MSGCHHTLCSKAQPEIKKRAPSQTQVGTEQHVPRELVGGPSFSLDIASHAGSITWTGKKKSLKVRNLFLYQSGQFFCIVHNPCLLVRPV